MPGAPSSSLSSASSLLSLLDKASSAIVVPLCGESRASIPSRVRRCFVFGVSAQTEPTALLRYHPLHEDRPSSMLSTNQALVSVRGTRERMCVQVVPSLSSAHASRVLFRYVVRAAQPSRHVSDVPLCLVSAPKLSQLRFPNSTRRMRTSLAASSVQTSFIGFTYYT